MPTDRKSSAFLVVVAGVMAALHVAKLPPVLSEVVAQLNISLVEAGFLLSTVQFAGMLLGITIGAVADGVGLRRCVIWGLNLLAMSSLIGSLAATPELLLFTRLMEGVGLLLVAMPAPALLRRLSPAHRLQIMLGLWGTYMPLGFILAMMGGPAMTIMFGWRIWWAVLAVTTVLIMLLVKRGVPPDSVGQRVVFQEAQAGPLSPMLNLPQKVRLTLASKGPWMVAIMFAMYSAQWLSVIGFLPSIFQAAGFSPLASGLLVAWIAVGNMGGNLMSGQLMQVGVGAGRILAIGFGAMAVTSIIGYAPSGLDLWPRYMAFWFFSAMGGLIPASLFSLAVRVSPDNGTVATTVGWVQQMSSLGQFAGPPAAAAVAVWSGGWELTWVLNVACCCTGLAACLLLRESGRGSRSV